METVPGDSPATTCCSVQNARMRTAESVHQSSTLHKCSSAPLAHLEIPAPLPSPRDIDSAACKSSRLASGRTHRTACCPRLPPILQAEPRCHDQPGLSPEVRVPAGPYSRHATGATSSTSPAPSATTHSVQ